MGNHLSNQIFIKDGKTVSILFIRAIIMSFSYQIFIIKAKTVSFNE